MSPDLALQMAHDNRMPNLARLLSTGACSETQNPPGLVVGGVWPTLTTGVWPSTHGFYSERQIIVGSYEARIPTPEVITVDRVWDVLSRAGRRCAILDVPITAPARELNGVQLVEWGAHDRFIDTCSTPRSFASEVLERHGTYPVQPKCDPYTRRGDVEGLAQALVLGIDAKERLATFVLSSDDWDLFWAVFAESHCAGHNFWSLHDPDHPAHDPTLRRELGDPLVEIYERLDAALGRLLDQIGDNATVMVLLSHGMGAHYDGGHLLFEILQRLDVADDGPRRWRSAAERLRRRWNRRRYEARKARPIAAERRFFKVPNNDLYGGIRVNLKGREPRGRVNPGHEYGELLARLRADLLDLKDPDTGAQLVREAIRADELYEGPHLDSLPDLIVHWNWDAPIVAASSPKIGTIRGVATAIRTGDHRENGVLVAHGPRVVPGALPRQVRAVDVAPTIAAMLDVQLPGVDGRPITGLVYGGT
jgi:predicted AlkP superfamily phosphohydrolase/phosphomutase